MNKESLEAVIYYDETSKTHIRWKKDIFVGKNFNRKVVSAGDVAGCLNKKTGYYQVRINRKTYKVHRLVMLLFGHVLPKGTVVDHINGDKSDNNIQNLRVVDTMASNKNRIYDNSNTKIPYLHLSDKLKRYQVTLVLKGKRTTKTFPFSKYENPLLSAITYLLGKEQEMLVSGYTLRQINNLKKGINEHQSICNR